MTFERLALTDLQKVGWGARSAGKMNVILQGMHQKFFQFSRTIVHIGQWAIVGIVVAYSLGTPFLLQAKVTLNSMTKDQAVKLGEHFGIIVGEVDEEIREFLGLERAEGVVVFEVIGGKPAALAGIKPRAIIKEIDSVEISTLVDFGRALEAAMTTENFSLVTYEPANATDQGITGGINFHFVRIEKS
jgi:membrane-associated protease RseP (regulator of RpoE activity)